MATIFVSYRRSDSQDVTGRIYDRLVGKYAQKQIFKDVDSIPLGVSFPAHIRQLLSKTNIVLVIIGPSWIIAEDEQGRRRLDDPNDFVRLEVEQALRAEMPVIPVLVSNARMPLANELPPSMRPLASRNGIAVRPDPDFNNDMARLFTGLEHLEKLLKLDNLDKILKPKVVKPVRPARPASVEIIEAQLVALPPKPKPAAHGQQRVEKPERPPPEPRRPRRSASLMLALVLFFLAAVLLATGAFWYGLAAWRAENPLRTPNPGVNEKDKFDAKDNKDLSRDKPPDFKEKAAGPGDPFERAQLLTLNPDGSANHAGFIAQQTDTAFYRFIAPRSGAVRTMFVRDKGDLLDAYLVCYDSARKQIPIGASISVAAGQTYYVKVIPFTVPVGGLQRTGGFTLQLRMDADTKK